MKRKLLAAVLVVAAAGLLALTVTTASATPTKTTRCTGCHSGPNVAVSATLVSSSATGATYQLSAPSATAMAVFDGTTKVGSSIMGTTGRVTLAFGKTYTIFAIQGPTNNDGIGSASVSPVAPAPVTPVPPVPVPPVPVADTTAPVTTSNVQASYSGAAAIVLTALDNAGGSGVAHTYYILDGAAQTEGTDVSTSGLGGHTLSFWSVDVAGNAELANVASFDVTAAPVPTTKTCTIDSTKASRRHGHRIMRLTGTITPGQVGDHAYLYVQKPGSHRWVRVARLTAKALNEVGGATWSYTYTMNVRGTYHFQVRLAGHPVETEHQVERD